MGYDNSNNPTFVKVDNADLKKELKTDFDELSTGINTDITQFKTQTTAQLADKAKIEDVQSVSNQVANIIANNGNGTVPTELVDLRTGVDGTVYTTAKQRADADINKRISKLNLANFVNNSDFGDGVTGWNKAYGSVSAVSNVLKFVADGTNAYPILFQDTPLPYIANHKIYISALVKSTKNTPNYIQMKIRNSSGGTYQYLQTTPELNVESIISGVVTPTDGAGGTFRVMFEFGGCVADSTIEVRKVMAFDLTAIFGVGKEPSKEVFEGTLNKYISGSFISKSTAIPVMSGNVEQFNLSDGIVTKPHLGNSLSQEIDSKANKIVLSNKLLNPNFNGLSNWLFTLASGTAVSNELTFTATSKFGQVTQDIGLGKTGRKYYVCANVSSTNNQTRVQLIRADTGAPFGEVNHSGSGAYEKLSLIAVPTLDTAIKLRIIDYKDNGWSPIKVKEVVVIDLTEIFGLGNEPTIEEFESILRKYNNNGLFIQKSLITNLIITDLYKPQVSPDKSILPIFAKRIGDKIQVVSKYNDTKDMRVTLERRGANNLLDFSTFHLIDNVQQATSKDMSNGTLFHNNATDFFGPHVVKAVSNINGDMPSSGHFTGGNHAYNGDATGTVTARTTEVTMYVDGRKVTNFLDYANYIDIYWSNRVQATNTKKSDGTGREVLQENYHLHFDGVRWSVDSNIEFLEDVTWLTYYGLQCGNNAWSQGVLYHTSPNRKWNLATSESDSGNKICDLVSLRKDGHYLEMGLDNTHGIGRREFLASEKGCFTKPYNKTYFNLVDYAQLTTGDNVSFKGHYRLFSK